MSVNHSICGRLAILTSGGDAPGMNPALRAVVRTALDAGVEVVAVTEGFRGLVVGGTHLRPMDWTRSEAFSTAAAPSSALPGARRSVSAKGASPRPPTCSSMASTG